MPPLAPTAPLNPSFEGSTRRSFLVFVATGASAVASGAQPSTQAATPPPTTAPAALPAPPPGWPAQAPELAREMVGVAHGNAARVRELLDRWPTLANATWDWGFGDWENALGAASHVGNREIAELLLVNGARPTIFSATMLGQLDVVRATIAARPGVERTKGPHGLTLLHHARAGGDAALPVLRYLEELGTADPRPALVPLTEADETALLGDYRYGHGETELVKIGKGKFGLFLQRSGAAERPIHHLGNLEFVPAGSDRARIRFRKEGARAVACEVHDPDLVLVARRS